MKKLFLAILLALLAGTAPALIPADTAAAIPFTATAHAEDEAVGTCGDNLSWSLDSEGVLTISGSGTTIKSGAFMSNTSIKSVVIPSNVTTIDAAAFIYCTALEEISFPDSLTSIGTSAFSDCTNLSSVVIGDDSTLSAIGQYVFQNCSSLTKIKIPATVTSIGNNAFYGSGLETVVIAPGATEVVANAFNGCASLAEVILPAGLTSIDEFAFAGCTSLTSIEIPSTVESIGQYAFSTTGLTSITIPTSVTTLDRYVFNACTALTQASIPAGILSGSDFGACPLTTLTITGNGIIPDDALKANKTIEAVTITSGITGIGDNAFAGCTALKSITVPSNVTSIGEAAFADCTTLTSATAPGSLITDTTFKGSAVADLILTGSGAVADTIFRGSTALTNVIISKDITSIGNKAFDGCSNLAAVTFESGSVLTTIGDSAFNYCLSLTDINLPPSLDKIGDSAFISSGLTKLTIPSGVTSIGKSIVDSDCAVTCYADKDTAVDPSNVEDYSVTYVPNITNSSMISGNISELPETIYDAKTSDEVDTPITDSAKLITVYVNVNNSNELSKYSITLKNNGVTVDSGEGTYKNALADMSIIQVLLSADTELDEVELVLYDSSSNAVYTENVKFSTEV